ncbi:MAG: UvrD-helicase domain-containing protein [Dysgonamonadaceae bacterium]|jgi:DNA helicase-2/ATP-dependent DNA helicase PcrA|nr:UvrD-helicase domain-containing protein [Dysgonamonadaceae bacterium]
MEVLLQQLNPSQREAVVHQDGPSLVIAGAGSGKTRVLTYKIAYRILQGTYPYRILALTFTNKAANEMKERIAGLVGEETARQLWMGTFHSICSRILRREAGVLGFDPNFTIYDASDSKNLLRTIIKEINLDEKTYKPGVVQNRISNAKNALFTPEQYAADKELIEYDTRSHMPNIKIIYQIYQNRCFQSEVMDFDDLLLYTNILFHNYPEILQKYQQHFQAILVDEYQDTNYAQHLIVQQLAQLHQNVCVVGDDAQSIYSFRGANIDNILKFKDVYPDTRIFKLEQNYRSTQTIVNAANSLIGKNVEQIHKKVYSEKEKGEKIQVLSAYSDYEEGYSIAARISEMRMQKQYAYKDFAILYRTNAQSRIFEESLRKNNIPYKIYGGLSFFQRKEIKDIIAYFRMTVNPHDEEALKRTINYPARGIGNTTINKITHVAIEQNISLWAVLSDPAKYDLPINAGTAAKLAGYKALVDSFIEQNEAAEADILGKNIMQKTGIVNDLYADKTPEGLSRVQNMEELLNSLKTFVQNRKEEGIQNLGLVDFLAEVALMTDTERDADEKEASDRVTMMTIHASKGLEFKNVLIVGMEEELFPLPMAIGSPKGMEEERRLFYVAVTRAEENCILSYAKSRFQLGEYRTKSPSRFLKDIDPEYLKMPEYLKEVDSWMPSFTRRRNVTTTETFKAPWEEKEEKTLSSPSFAKLPATEATQKKMVSQIGDLSVGNIIRHERFGSGSVTALEGDIENAKATVDFEKFGKKQLLLKFARYEIVG